MKRRLPGSYLDGTLYLPVRRCPNTGHISNLEATLSHNDDTILAALMQQDGQLVDETGIYFEGNKRVIPLAFKDDPLDYVSDLHSAILALEEGTQVQRRLAYRPWDVAVVMENIFRDYFGMSLASIAGSGQTIPVTLDHKDTTMSVPWGRFSVGFLKGTLRLGSDIDEKQGLITVITITLPLKNKPAAESFLDMVTKEMSTRSIYRGKAISGGEQPDFMDYLALDPASVIYTDQVFAELNAHIWSRIRNRGELTEDGIDFKRAVLVFGPWGTGKTLVGDLTARICVENDVTYIYGRTGDSLAALMQLARQYQPAVVFVEDADTIPAGNDKQLAQLLELFDGLDAKHNDVMVVMTTNHVERIPAGMLRPGRLDHIIQIEHMDDVAREKFVRAFLPTGLVDPNLDMGPINEAMQGYVAAYVKAAVQNAIWYARSDNDGKRPTVVTTQNIVHAANGLRAQYNLHMEAQEGHGSGATMESLVQSAVAPVMAEMVGMGVSVLGRSIEQNAIQPDTVREIVSGEVDNVLDGARVIDTDDGELSYEIRVRR